MAARRGLFSNNAGGLSAGRKHLLEFKAGKMTMKGKMVHPDKRKGLVYLHQTDDSLMHFCWKDRTSNVVVDDLIIFPDDAEYKRVNECKTGRVYVLKFKSLNRKFFFWMQEPKTDKDEEYSTKVNDLLNNPPAPGSASAGGNSVAGLPSDLGGDGEFQNMLSGMNPQHLMQLFGGMGGLGGMNNILSGNARSSSTPQSTKSESTTPSTTTTASSANSTSTTTTPATTTPTTTTATADPNSVNLQSLISNLNSAAATSGGQQLDLSGSLNLDTIRPILSNPETLQQLAALLPKTESEKDAAEEVKNTVQSPQFQQAMGMFSAALQSGQLGPLMNQFGLGQDVVNAANNGDMEAFIKALQKGIDSKPKKEEENTPKKEDKDDDEGMSLD